jgi:citrate synthase
MSRIATLEIDGKKYELPIIEGTENETAIDIKNLRNEAGVITLDPGYKNKAFFAIGATLSKNWQNELLS